MDPKTRIGSTSASQDARAADAVVRRLREAILDGQLAPGVRIPQQAVARELGSSRIPVREALRQLENEGLVHIVPQRGARVAELDFEEADEMYRIREQLEPLALLESIPRLTNEQLQELKRLAGAMSKLDHTSVAADPKEWLELDRRFHLLSYSAAPLPRLLRMVESCWNTTQKYRRVLCRTLTEHDAQLVHARHWLLLEAFERRDAVDAQRTLATHIGRGRYLLQEHRVLLDTPLRESWLPR